MSMKEPVEAPYRLNLSHPEIREAYEAYKLRHGIPHPDPPSDQEREAFEREWMAAYLAACRREEGKAGCLRLFAFGPVAMRMVFGDDGQALYQVEDSSHSGEPVDFGQPLEAWSNFIDRVDTMRCV